MPNTSQPRKAVSKPLLRSAATFARNLLVAAVGLLAGVGASAAAATCADLSELRVPAIDIGLPTRGATIRSARHKNGADGDYCKVIGTIASLDAKASWIRFEVNLPENWNEKALQFGGGGFDGYLRQSDGRRWTVVGDKSKPSPLALGFATFGSDSGHHHHFFFLPDIANIARGKFALNDEERNNFASDALKKVHDAAIAVMNHRYGALPKRMYFIGGSNGGREALKVVDNWPTDYDGAMAAYASWNQMETDVQFIHIAQAIYAKGPDGHSGWLPTRKTKLLRKAVMDACDAQDGLKDGIVSNPEGCNFDLASLTCIDGMDHKGCLSEGQKDTVLAFSEPTITALPVANGMTRAPGYNVLRGADLVGNLGWFRHPFHPAIPYFNSFYYVIGDQVVRNFLAHGPRVSLFDIDTFHNSVAGHDPKEFLSRVQEHSREDDASLADLSPFEKHGGKLLLVHGVADSTISTQASILLYTRIVEAMGQERAERFLRLYLIPGFGHGQGAFNAGFETIGVLDRWADGDVAPGDLVAVDQNKNARRSRLLCVWPGWPRYLGGDIMSAASFRCEGIH